MSADAARRPRGRPPGSGTIAAADRRLAAHRIDVRLSERERAEIDAWHAREGGGVPLAEHCRDVLLRAARWRP